MAPLIDILLCRLEDLAHKLKSHEEEKVKDFATSFLFFVEKLSEGRDYPSHWRKPD